MRKPKLVKNAESAESLREGGLYIELVMTTDCRWFVC